MTKKLTAEELDQVADRTEHDLNRLARELDRGESAGVRVRRKPGRPPMGSAAAEPIRVRLDPELREAVAERARADGMSDSEVVREALRGYLHVS